MYQLFLDALNDSARTIPLLLIIYVSIELIEYRFGNQIKKDVEKAKSAGPLVGALSGSFPQCGFSVIISALYTQRLATIGTLLAVYLSTSDEAIPIILSEPKKAPIIIPLILTKIFIAIIAGFSIDFMAKRSKRKTLAHIKAYATGVDNKSHHHERKAAKTACCGHSINNDSKKIDLKEIFLHPAIHTLKIFGFIFAITFLLNFAFYIIGEGNIESFLSKLTIVQPLLTALIGLIPNCAASVAITELYLKGVITYGAIISGLCASGGLGLLILMREEKNKRKVITIIGLLFGISVFSGVLIQFFSSLITH